MRITLTRLGTWGLSLLGDWYQDGLELTSCERAWNGNVAGQSAVAAGFYYLEPHNGTKYRDTWALIGAGVSHLPERGVPRSACVLHWAATGEYLAGCISLANRAQLRPGLATLPRDGAINQALEQLNDLRDERHTLEIREAFPISQGLAYNAFPAGGAPRLVY